MKNVTIIASSLDKNSKSQRLARLFQEKLGSIPSQLIDMREVALPMAGTEEAWASEAVNQLRSEIESSSHVVFAVPIYCYDVNAVAKSVIELAGRALSNKVVGFICAAGGDNSYMSVMGFANHLMLDFRSIICPRFVYASPSSWSEEGIPNAELDERLGVLVRDLSMIHVSSS